MRHSKHFIVIVILSILWLGCADHRQLPGLNISADFDNGNAEIKEIDQTRREITITPRNINDARDIWWHFQITGIIPGEEITVRVEDFYSSAGEINLVYSYDKETWHRTDDSKSPYLQKFTESSVWIARNIPYPYEFSLELARRLQDNPNVMVSDLCRSEENRRVIRLRFTDSAVPDAEKKIIWVQARQHAFESHSSWEADGLAMWLAGDSPEAVELRKRAVVNVIPIMDVDNVYKGGAGKDQKPVDFNRCWRQDEQWNAVKSAIETLDEETLTAELAVFIDLHSPWYPELHHWHVPAGTDSTVIRTFGNLFVKDLRERRAPNSWENEYVYKYIAQTNEAAVHLAMSRWIKNPSEAFAIVMETAHWKDNNGTYISKEGLTHFGESLGRAFLKLLKR